MITSETIALAVTSTLERGAPAWVRAVGQSMLPTIWTGARVRVLPCTSAEVRRGDVLLLGTVDGLTLHRAVRREGDRWITQGDGVAVPDEPRSHATILGRVDGLVVGRWHFASVPGSVQRIVRYGYAVVAPGIRRTYLGVRDGTRPLRRRVERGLGGTLRRWRVPYHGVRIERLSGENVGDFRSYMMRRGAQPTPKRVAQWAALAREEGGFCVVARARRGIVGSIHVLEDPAGGLRESPLALDLWVGRAYRGLGIAQSLVASLTRGADEKKYDRVRARVREDNEASLRLLERNGFVPEHDPSVPEGYVMLVRVVS